MIELEQQLLEIKEKKRFDAFTHMCDGFDAAGFQSVSVLLWLYAKKGLFRFDPGMGKTYAIAMGITALFNVNKKSKCIFFIKKAQITQTANDIRLYTKKKVVTCTAEQEQIDLKLFRDIDSYDILMLTHEGLNSDLICFFIQQNIKYFNICVVDEAHYLTNICDCDRVVVLSAITAKLPYVAFLTAAPFISKAEQFASLLNIMDLVAFQKKSQLLKMLKTGYQIDKAFPLKIYNYDRKSVGIENTYRVYVNWVDPHDFQRNLKGNLLLQKLRGPGSYNQVNELLRVLKLKISEKKKGIVFVYYHETRERLLPIIKETGIKYGCINGNTSQKERDQIQSQFQKNELDVVIISVTTSINLDCDYIYFYQYTLEIKQILGRGERGLNPKVMELYFQFTRHTADAQYFLDNVYMLSQQVRLWIGAEYTEFLQVGGELLENMGFNLSKVRKIS